MLFIIFILKTIKMKEVCNNMINIKRKKNVQRKSLKIRISYNSMKRMSFFVHKTSSEVLREKKTFPRTNTAHCASKRKKLSKQMEKKYLIWFKKIKLRNFKGQFFLCNKRFCFHSILYQIFNFRFFFFL